jgi:tRNA nucleotidyltransferase (CCA-adding enzyme)
MEIITTHLNADFDAMASMVAAKKLYPEAVLVFPGSQERTLREFFVSAASYLYNFARLKNLDLDQVERLILVDTRQMSRIGRFAKSWGGPAWKSISTTITPMRKTMCEGGLNWCGPWAPR